MKTKLALIFAATFVASCSDWPQSTKASQPATSAPVLVVEDTTASTVNAITPIGSLEFYEVTPRKNSDVDCFFVVGDAGGQMGPLDCVPKTGAQALSKGRVTIQSSTQIPQWGGGTVAGYFYEITPATRPDLRCFIALPTGASTMGRATTKCLPKPR